MHGDGAASGLGQCRVSLPDVQIKRVLRRFGQFGTTAHEVQHTIDY
jgi:hypothetical protein